MLADLAKRHHPCHCYAFTDSLYYMSSRDSLLIRPIRSRSVFRSRRKYLLMDDVLFMFRYVVTCLIASGRQVNSSNNSTAATLSLRRLFLTSNFFKTSSTSCQSINSSSNVSGCIDNTAISCVWVVYIVGPAHFLAGSPRCPSTALLQK